MAGIDKAAIGFSIAIVAIGVGFAAYMGAVQDAGPVATSPAITPRVVEPSANAAAEAEAAAQAAAAEAEAMAAEAEAAAQAAAAEAEAMAAEAEAAAQAAAAEAEAMAAEAEAAAQAAAAEAEAMAAEAEAAAQAAAAEAEAMAAGPQTHTVDVPEGTSTPGCESNNACYLPADITINAGDTVEWDNIDTAAHTVTSGSPANGPSGVFDSSLLMGSASYAFTFEETGSYDYFCIVHPWMAGTVTVN